MFRKTIEVHNHDDLKKVDEFLALDYDIKFAFRYSGLTSWFYEFIYVDR